MAHPYQHSLSAAKKWGGKPEDYMPINEWFDETKGWVCHSIHRAFRHHAEGIFEAEKRFGTYIINSDGIKVYTRYIGERHIREDCNGKVPTAMEWLEAIRAKVPPMWAMKTLDMKEYE